MTLAAGTYPYKPPPKNANNTIGFWKELLLVVQNLYDGKIQCTGQVTLVENETSTVVIDPRCCEQSVVHLSPFSANAVAVVNSTYVSSYGNGTFTITHTSLSSADRIWRYAIIG
jgi:hypothetical protein